jgi:dTDP-4-amino-4,6-dideoxy-D-galactose acyltransferase
MGHLCTLLTWDSDHWGFPVARLNGHQLTGDTAREALLWCEEHKVKCLYFAAEGTCAGTLHAAWANGFRCVDVRVDMQKTFPAGEAVAPHSGKLREARPDDLPALEQLARTAHEDTRFFKDANFDRTQAADLYALWVARDFREHKVFVAVSADDPQGLSGYVSASEGGNKEGRIGLVAVNPEARGRGLGRLLVGHAVSWCRSRGADSVKVATQATNVAAMRLYEQGGFRVADVKVWFHRWFD